MNISDYKIKDMQNSIEKLEGYLARKESFVKAIDEELGTENREFLMRAIDALDDLYSELRDSLYDLSKNSEEE